MPVALMVLSHSVDSLDFLRCMEVENHDDFYNFHDDGSVRVWDQKGVGIVYDSAMLDLQDLEEELMRVGSYYMRAAHLRQRLARVTGSECSISLGFGACVQFTMNCRIYMRCHQTIPC